MEKVAGERGAFFSAPCAMDSEPCLPPTQSESEDECSVSGVGCLPLVQDEDPVTRHLLIQKRKYAQEVITRFLIPRHARKASLMTTSMPWMVGYNPFLQGFFPKGRKHIPGELAPLFDSSGMFSTLKHHKDDLADFCLDIFFQWRFFRDSPVKNHSPIALFDSWNDFRQLVMNDSDGFLHTLYHRRDNFRHVTLGSMIEIHEASISSTGICGVERKYQCPMCYPDTPCVDLKVVNGRYTGFAYDTPSNVETLIIDFKRDKDRRHRNKVLKKLVDELNEIDDLKFAQQAMDCVEAWIKGKTSSQEPQSAPTNALELIEQQLKLSRARSEEHHDPRQIERLEASILTLQRQQSQDRSRLDSCVRTVAKLARQQSDSAASKQDNHLLHTYINMTKKHARKITEVEESLLADTEMILSNASKVAQLEQTLERLERRVPYDEELTFLDELDSQLNNSP